MRIFFAEFVGTFFLVFAICLAVTGGLANFAPLVIGLTLMVMVYACGHLSGAHFNPAVSTAILLRRKITPGECFAYVVTQLIAAVVAAGVVIGMKGGGGNAAGVTSAGSAFAAEMIGTFALAWVVLNVATARASQGNSFFGVAIGLTVGAMAYVLGPFSGGAFNPAVAIGGAVFGIFRWADIWIHILGSLIGGSAAAIAFRATHPDE
ncbi:MAG: aquaporin [Phycisphaerales bacterium]